MLAAGRTSHGVVLRSPGKAYDVVAVTRQTGHKATPENSGRPGHEDAHKPAIGIKRLNIAARFGWRRAAAVEDDGGLRTHRRTEAHSEDRPRVRGKRDAARGDGTRPEGHGSLGCHQEG